MFGLNFEHAVVVDDFAVGDASQSQLVPSELSELSVWGPSYSSTLALPRATSLAVNEAAS